MSVMLQREKKIGLEGEGVMDTSQPGVFIVDLSQSMVSCWMNGSGQGNLTVILE